MYTRYQSMTKITLIPHKIQTSMHQQRAVFKNTHIAGAYSVLRPNSLTRVAQVYLTNSIRYRFIKTIIKIGTFSV